MKKIEASKLNRSLKQVLDGIAAGERYEITRYGKTVAKLLPPNAREPKTEEWRPTPMVPQEMHAGREAEPKKELTPEQLRQKRRDALLNLINRPKK